MAETFSLPINLAKQTVEQWPAFLQWLQMSDPWLPCSLVWSELPQPKHLPFIFFRKSEWFGFPFEADCPCLPPCLLQSTDQFFLFPLLLTTQYTAHSTTPSAYKYSTCTRTSCPAHIVLTACPTCLQPIPYQPPPPVRCHRLLRAPPRLWPATAASGKPASPTSATFP